MKSESSKNISQPQTGKLAEVTRTKQPETPDTGISQLRIQDIMLEAIFALRTMETDALKQAQANLNGLKEKLNEQIDTLKNIADKLS